MSFNLDPLALRAHAKARDSAYIHTFTGRDAGPFTHVLKSSYPFLLRVHGQLDDEASWVFTQSKLNKLLADRAYLNFVANALASHTVMFLGITADDVAISTHFEILRNQSIELGNHFWITDRSDPAADRWAENAGVRIINYSSSDPNHSELTALLDGFLSHISYDKEARPQAPQQRQDTLPNLPDPSSILLLLPEEIRSILNTHASMILAEHTEEALEKYAEFCQEYDRAIYQSWYVTTEPPNNTILGYTVSREMKQGAFGRVFEGTDSEGQKVAIKILREDIRRNGEMLQSFRRGVQSMDILSKSHVDGMVPYIETSEIPTLAVMKYVEGPDLRDAVSARAIESWGDVLNTALQLATILRRAHRLPERVLHRDIRPSNVMIRDLYTQPDAWKVVVLDFDLSWYRGALGVSIHGANTMAGYLAPEQIAEAHGQSTRNALVDSYGLGMTLFYLRSSIDPSHLQHMHVDWKDTVYSRIRKFGCDTWVSVPTRFTRMILNATLDKQNERWDMAQIQGELEQLNIAVNSPGRVEAIELWTEEIAARAAAASAIPHDYIWEIDHATARIQLPRGLAITVAADEKSRVIRARIGWTATGDEKYDTVRKYLPQMCKRASDALKKSGWKLKGKPDHRVDLADCNAEIPLALVQSELEGVSASIAKAAEEMTFS